MAKVLAPHCKSILGVDISQSMVDQFNSMAKESALEDKLVAIRADLSSDDVPQSLQGKEFDVIFVSLLMASLPKLC